MPRRLKPPVIKVNVLSGQYIHSNCKDVTDFQELMATSNNSISRSVVFFRLLCVEKPNLDRTRKEFL